MKRASWLFAVLTCASLTGCVERRFIIEATSAVDGTPVSAQVLRNGQSVGFAPVDDSFVYYGKYEFTLIKDGYQTLHVLQPVRPPWWEIPPIDFISENLIPFKLRDIRRFSYPMQPLQTVPPGDVLQRGTILRQQGQSIGEPRPVVVPPAAAPAATPAAPAGTPAPATMPPASDGGPR